MGDGVIVEDAEGRQMWDNRFLKRLERMWPELRRHIAVQVSFVPGTGSGGNSQ
jgi:vacuolar-type H+-ATPase subunit E/Vma4